MKSYLRITLSLTCSSLVSDLMRLYFQKPDVIWCIRWCMMKIIIFMISLLNKFSDETLHTSRHILTCNTFLFALFYFYLCIDYATLVLICSWMFTNQNVFSGLSPSHQMFGNCLLTERMIFIRVLNMEINMEMPKSACIIFHCDGCFRVATCMKSSSGGHWSCNISLICYF